MNWHATWPTKKQITIVKLTKIDISIWRTSSPSVSKRFAIRNLQSHVGSLCELNILPGLTRDTYGCTNGLLLCFFIQNSVPSSSVDPFAFLSASLEQFSGRCKLLYAR